MGTLEHIHTCLKYIKQFAQAYKNIKKIVCGNVCKYPCHYFSGTTWSFTI